MATDKQNAASPRKQRLTRILLVVAVLLALNGFGVWVGHLVNFQLFPRHEPLLHAILLTVVGLYTLLMAIPFMPGIEVGMAIMLMLGHKSALLIYLCTLLALSASFAMGKFFPLSLVKRFLGWLYLDKARGLIELLEPLNREERLALLNQKAPARLAPFLLRHRYLTIALLLNLPGNALLGGGGGIGLVVGMSGIIPFFRFFLVTAVAVLPVPLLIYLQGV